MLAQGGFAGPYPPGVVGFILKKLIPAGGWAGGLGGLHLGDTCELLLLKHAREVLAWLVNEYNNTIVRLNYLHSHSRTLTKARLTLKEAEAALGPANLRAGISHATNLSWTVYSETWRVASQTRTFFRLDGHTPIYQLVGKDVRMHRWMLATP
jgi:hypothetical protein